MKIALVTTPPSVRSGIGDYTHHLLPYLRELAAVDQFVEPGREGAGWDGEPARSALELSPRAYDRVLYQLGNEANHGFMARMVRAIGGTVAQHDWVLFDLAMNAYPGLVRGGWKGHLLALREGGVDQARTYLSNWRDRRRARTRPAAELDPRALPGVLVAGWHAPEPRGRWTSDTAWVRVPHGARALRVTCFVERGRTVHLTEVDGRIVARGERGEQAGRVALEGGLRETLVALRTTNVGVTEEQRKHGDARRLATFVETLEWSDGSAWHALDLRQGCFHPPESVDLSRDRFQLPLNHSIVRFGDAFIVHSRYVASRIASERNQLTPVGIVHHGAEERWRDEPRATTRARLGLPQPWQRGFLLVSFGGVQAHKRIDKLLEAVARARAQAPDVYLALIGGIPPGAYDPREHARQLGIGDAVHFSGYVPEEVGWEWLHAGDLSVNLRGPTTGGTSGGVFQAFSLGRAVLASDAGEQSELPDDCTVKVPLGADEVDAIARELVALQRDPARREGLESSVRRFVAAECSWKQCAQKYVEYLDRFPPARASRKGLIDLKLGLGSRRAAV